MIVDTKIIFDDLEEAIKYFARCNDIFIEQFEGLPERQKIRLLKTIIYNPAIRICGNKARELVMNNIDKRVITKMKLDEVINKENERTEEERKKALELYDEIKKVFTENEIEKIIREKKGDEIYPQFEIIENK